MEVTGTRVFTKTHRASYLKRLPTQSRRKVFELLYDRLDAAEPGKGGDGGVGAALSGDCTVSAHSWYWSRWSACVSRVCGYCAVVHQYPLSLERMCFARLFKLPIGLLPSKSCGAIVNLAFENGAVQANH